MELSAGTLVASISSRLPLRNEALYPGKVFPVKIIAAEGNNVLLEMFGQRMQVESNVSFQTGEQTYLKLDKISPEGTIFLRRAEATEVDNFRQVAGIIQRAGVTETQQNFSIVLELLQQGVNQDAGLQQLVEVAEKLQLPPAKIPALVWLWKNQLPITLQTIDLVSAGQNLRAGSMGELVGLAQNVLGQEGVQAEKLLTVLERANLGSAYTSGQIREILQGLSEILGLTHELNILSGKKKEISLKELLLSLTQSSTLSTQQRETVKNFLGRLTQLQLLSQKADQSFVLALESYADWRGERSPVYIKFEGGKPGVAADESSVSYAVYLFLATPRFGRIASNIRLLNGVLNVKVELEKASTQRLFQRHLAELKDKLGKIPFIALQSLTVSVKESGAMRNDWQREFGFQVPGGLDVRV